jgi:hypothetical protein
MHKWARRVRRLEDYQREQPDCGVCGGGCTVCFARTRDEVPVGTPRCGACGAERQFVKMVIGTDGGGV